MALNLDEIIITVDNDIVNAGVGQVILLVSGIQGESATINVGTVTTLPAGSPAAVRNSGSEQHAVLDFDIPKGVDGDNASVWGNILGDLADQTDLSAILKAKAPMITDSVSGDPVAIPDALAESIAGLSVSIEPVQAGSGTVSPDNIRQISGHTGATISYSGEDQSDPETLTVSWQATAGTVYRGTLDVLTGALIVTDVLFTLDGTEDGWAVDIVSDRTRCYNQLLASVYDLGYTVNNTYIEAFTNIFPRGENSVTYINNGEFILRRINSRQRIDLNYQGVTTKQQWTDYLALHPLQICAKLAAPLTYQITPGAAFSLAAGENHISCSTGAVSVTYKADTKGYIDKKFAELQAMILENI